MWTKRSPASLKEQATPFYYYDLEVLDRTIDVVRREAAKRAYQVHYAMKANADPLIMERFRRAGIGVDCVSGNEVRWALECGFEASDVVFAGVGKREEEIAFALEQGIFAFNVESLQELELIDQLALEKGTRAPIALRINPDVDPETHQYITTGLEENKFGLDLWGLDEVFQSLKALKGVDLKGLHFHIGSQIREKAPFRSLCLKVREVKERFEAHGYELEHLNLGGGLGVDHSDPDGEGIPDLEAFFDTFREHLERPGGPELHFELGRALTAHCGDLITRVLYIKKGWNTSFAIVDAGMTELIRPALYRSFHRIEPLQDAGSGTRKYDVVGPVCETSDLFGKQVELPELRRGDLLAIRSVGAYGEVMASSYNLRERAEKLYSSS
ncbi:MAG: diaminopimelate decarboxylase [Flavobacteriales bacterium]